MCLQMASLIMLCWVVISGRIDPIIAVYRRGVFPEVRAGGLNVPGTYNRCHSSSMSVLGKL